MKTTSSSKPEKTRERIVPEHMTGDLEKILFYRHVAAYDYAIAHLSDTDKVLEVGCGDGYGTAMISKKVNQVLGLDVDADTVDYENETYGSENCLFKIYDGKTFPLEDNSFDVVVTFQVIEHVEDDTNFISEIQRVLKPRGVLYLSTPNKTMRIEPGKQPWNRFHAREYSAQELGQTIEEAFLPKGAVQVHGMFGTPEIQGIEKARMAKIQTMVRLDPFNLRKVLPERLRLSVIEGFKKILTTKKESLLQKQELEELSNSSYHLDDQNLDNSLDLYVIASK